MRNPSLSVGILMLFATTIGCQALPRSTGTGHLIEPEEALYLGFTLGPSVDLSIPQTHHIAHAQLLGDVLIIVEEPTNLVTAVSLRDCSTPWHRVVGNPVQKLFQPQRRDDQILINTESEIFLLDSDTGVSQGRQTLASPVNHRSDLTGELAIFGSMNGLIFAHNLDTGQVEWRKRMDDTVVAAPTVLHNQVFVADRTGLCRMLSAITGEYLWHFKTFGPVTAKAPTSRLLVFVASEDESLYALDRRTGSRQWIHRAGQPLKESPVIIDDLLFLNVAGKGMLAIEWEGATGGNVRWEFASQAQPVALINQRLLVNTTKHLVLIESDSGKTYKQVPVRRLQTVIGLDNGGILLISPKGKILRIDPVT